jgi:hypothetical protein
VRICVIEADEKEHVVVENEPARPAAGSPGADMAARRLVRGTDVAVVGPVPAQM